MAKGGINGLNGKLTKGGWGRKPILATYWNDWKSAQLRWTLWAPKKAHRLGGGRGGFPY